MELQNTDCKMQIVNFGLGILQFAICILQFAIVCDSPNAPTSDSWTKKRGPAPARGENRALLLLFEQAGLARLPGWRWLRSRWWSPEATRRPISG
jgi:hypothetical protein